jgi:hypothetical protein
MLFSYLSSPKTDEKKKTPPSVCRFPRQTSIKYRHNWSIKIHHCNFTSFLKYTKHTHTQNISVNMAESFDSFSANFPKKFSHQPCIVIEVAQSNLPPSPWSGNDNRNTQICCQAHFDPKINGGGYEIAFYDNGYAYYEALNGENLERRLERLNPQMEFLGLRKVLDKIKQIFEESSANKTDNHISVKLKNDDILVVDIKGNELIEKIYLK